jgi:hypothetical protein
MQAVNPGVNPAILINGKPLCFVMFLNAVLKKFLNIVFVFANSYIGN